VKRAGIELAERDFASAPSALTSVSEVGGALVGVICAAGGADELA
jgi:hypothetical protein